MTIRAVTTEAGVAKGLVHRHFADCDALLGGLVLDRTARFGTADEGVVGISRTVHRRRPSHRRAC
ncbi:hypothetical protein ACFW4X_20175 [Streptomyces smyrnaeus]|uniref:hypothetical protein n=1 Tax=Streptomyces smyrnaeus TaxID=1387713 RepID=UPI0036C497B6